MKLTWENFDKVFREVTLNDTTDHEVMVELDALASKGDKAAVLARAEALNVVVVEAAIQLVAFNKDRLEARRADIVSMLSELDPTFFESTGGGMSMMQMPFTKDGTQWGEQWQADLLYALGAGLGLCWYTLPRKSWNMLPGGMPYITVKDPQ